MIDIEKIRKHKKAIKIALLCAVVLAFAGIFLFVQRIALNRDYARIQRAGTLKVTCEYADGVFFSGENGESGFHYELIKAFAESQGLSDRVQFVGNQSDVNAWIAKADVGIQSSKWEGFGLTAVELMAAGKPVVATDVEGLRQVVEGAGLLFPVGDEERLATMVTRLLDDESYYKRIAGKCSERAKLYDIHVTVDQYLEIYNEIIGG